MGNLRVHIPGGTRIRFLLLHISLHDGDNHRDRWTTDATDSDAPHSGASYSRTAYANTADCGAFKLGPVDDNRLQQRQHAI